MPVVDISAFMASTVNESGAALAYRLVESGFPVVDPFVVSSIDFEPVPGIQLVSIPDAELRALAEEYGIRYAGPAARAHGCVYMIPVPGDALWILLDDAQTVDFPEAAIL